MGWKKRRPFLRTAAWILIVVLSMSSFTGCKYSPKLHELIQDRFNHLLDTKSAKEFENDFNRVEKTDELKAKEQDDTSDRKKEEKEEQAVEGKRTETVDEQPAAVEATLSNGNHTDASASEQQNPAAVPSKNTQGHNDAGNVEDTRSTNPASSMSGSGSGGSEDRDGNGENGGNGGNSTEGSGSGPGGNGEGSEGAAETSGNGITITPGNNGSRQIVDDRGETVDIPEEVSSVACSGQSAVLFCAVGGEQILQASSESFVANSMLDADTRTRVQPLWRGDGTGTMSGTDFDSLMALQPEVVVEISGTSAFSGDQVGQLQANGIRYVVLPPLDSIDHIQQAVRLAGQLTGDRSAAGGVNGDSLASQYASYVDNLIGTIQSRVRSAGTGSGFGDLGLSTDGYYNGKYSLYIQGWDDIASYSISNSSFSGMGAAYSGNNSTKICRLMTSLMSIGGVYNTMMKVEQMNARDLYIMPLAWWQSTMTLTLNGGLIPSEVNNGHVVRKKLLEHKNSMLGSDAFPAVVTRSRMVADNILSSPVWQKGTNVVSSDGAFQANGFLSLDESTLIASSIERDFSAYASPSGLGSWTDGSPESILESAWIASCFFGAYSEQDLEQMVGDFYSQFYRISLDSSQIRDILSGSGS